MQPKPKIYQFSSPLAPWFEAYLEEKHRLGYKYKGVDTLLKSLDTFLVGKDCKDSLPKDLLLEFITPKPHQKTATIRHNIYMLRLFAEFLNRNGINAYLLSLELMPKPSHEFEPYVFSYDEISRIISVVDHFKYNPRVPQRHIVYPLLFRVLCFCGLRISEALDLKVGDVDFDGGFFLLRDTKNCQDRIIPLDEGLKKRFIEYRDKMCFLSYDEYFFKAPDGKRYSLMTIEATFRNILQEAGIPYRGRGKGPRLHDLRHTFCVHSLQKLTEHGEDPYAVLPVLMTYVGHKSVKATSHYIHLSAESYPELLKKTESKFGYLIPKEDPTDV